VGNSGIDDNKKCRDIAGDFDHHVDAVVQCGVHRPMEHVPGFTRSHRMLPLDKCLRCIASAAAMVGEFIVQHKRLTKNNFLLANLR
jgi:hypothetical protein